MGAKIVFLHLFVSLIYLRLSYSIDKFGVELQEFVSGKGSMCACACMMTPRMHVLCSCTCLCRQNTHVHMIHSCVCTCVLCACFRVLVCF